VPALHGRSCEKVCPTTARHTRDKDGLVLTDYDVCIGCRYCQVACPYGVNYFQWDEPDTAYEDIDGLEDPDNPDQITHAEYDHGERWVDSRAPRGTMSKCTMCPSMQDGKQEKARSERPPASRPARRTRSSSETSKTRRATRPSTASTRSRVARSFT